MSYLSFEFVLKSSLIVHETKVITPRYFLSDYASCRANKQRTRLDSQSNSESCEHHQRVKCLRSAGFSLTIGIKFFDTWQPKMLVLRQKKSHIGIDSAAAQISKVECTRVYYHNRCKSRQFERRTMLKKEVFDFASRSIKRICMISLNKFVPEFVFKVSVFDNIQNDIWYKISDSAWRYQYLCMYFKGHATLVILKFKQG